MSLSGFAATHQGVVGDHSGLTPVILTGVAILLHFLGTDHALQERYGRLYDRLVRWLLAAGALIGWATSVFCS